MKKDIKPVVEESGRSETTGVFFKMITQEEKTTLKEAICRMIENGETSGLIDTVTYNPDLIKPSGKRRTWQVNIMKAIEIEIDIL